MNRISPTDLFAVIRFTKDELLTRRKEEKILPSITHLVEIIADNRQDPVTFTKLDPDDVSALKDYYCFLFITYLFRYCEFGRITIRKLLQLAVEEEEEGAQVCVGGNIVHPCLIQPIGR